MLSLIEKELKQMMRNKVLPAVFVLLPLMMLNVVPRIATQEVKNINFVVVDNDHSTQSARLTQRMAASPYFNLVAAAQTYRQAEEHVKSGTADIIVEIEPHFERNLVRDHVADIQVSANATNATKAAMGTAYATQIAIDPGTSPLSQRFLYNTRLDYKVYMVPAIIAMLLTLVIGFLPAMNIVLEKERGTIEQINVTPISPLRFMLSKLVPYWMVGVFMLFLSLAAAWLFHGLWPAGSLLAMLSLTTIYLLLISSLALVVSNYSATVQQAALLMFFFLVVFLLLSGLLTPVASMPRWAQLITEVNPLRFFIEPMRILYIKGSTASELTPYYVRLSLLAAGAAFWAVKSYKKSS